MSFLLEDSDAHFYVPDILALLDFEEESWARTLKVTEEPLVVACESKLRPHPETKSKKRKRAATPRLRNKGKIELLRREIEGLETELEALQRSKPMATSTNCHTESVWKGIASRQSNERERAERCNAGLRRMLSEQQVLTTSLSGVLSEWTSLSMPDSSRSTV